MPQGYGSSKQLRPDAPAEAWANAATTQQPGTEQSFNFDEGPFAPDYWEDTVLEQGEPEDD